jgi:hypothetical protein
MLDLKTGETEFSDDYRLIWWTDDDGVFPVEIDKFKSADAAKVFAQQHYAAAAAQSETRKAA